MSAVGGGQNGITHASRAGGPRSGAWPCGRRALPSSPGADAGSQDLVKGSAAWREGRPSWLRRARGGLAHTPPLATAPRPAGPASRAFITGRARDGDTGAHSRDVVVPPLLKSVLLFTAEFRSSSRGAARALSESLCGRCLACLSVNQRSLNCPSAVPGARVPRPSSRPSRPPPPGKQWAAGRERGWGSGSGCFPCRWTWRGRSRPRAEGRGLRRRGRMGRGTVCALAAGPAGRR